VDIIGKEHRWSPDAVWEGMATLFRVKAESRPTVGMHQTIKIVNRFLIKIDSDKRHQERVDKGDVGRTSVWSSA
jgi:hypothetical protein